MMINRRAPRHLSLLGFALAMGLANAQSPINVSDRTPAPTYQLDYRSTFQGYNTYQPQKIESWKAANDTVKEIGGWRVYTREGAQAEAPPSPMPADKPVPITQPILIPKAPEHRHGSGSHGAHK